MRLLVLVLPVLLIAFDPLIAQSQETKPKGSGMINSGDSTGLTRADGSPLQQPASGNVAGARRSSVPIIAGDVNGARIKASGRVINQNGVMQ